MNQPFEDKDAALLDLAPTIFKALGSPQGGRHGRQLAAPLSGLTGIGVQG